MKKFTTIILSLIMVILAATAIGCGKKDSKSCKITFDANGGEAILNTVEVSSITAIKGNEIILPEARKTGYTFNYWELDGSEFDKGSFNFSKDITLVAKYTANTYTVKFSGVTPEISDMTVTFGSSYTLQEPSKAGYTFNGWKSGNVSVGLTGNWSIADSVTLTPDFIPAEYSVSYNLDGGAFATGITPFDKATYQEIIQLYAPTKAGYIFKGWKVEGSNALYNNNTTYNFTSNVTFVAVWEEDKVIKLTLNAGDGSFGALKTKTITLEKGASYDLTKHKTTAPANKVFEGWYFGETKVENSGTWNYDFGKEITLTAKYVSVDVVVFTLNLDGGTLKNGYPSTHEFFKGSNYDLTNYIAEKANYRFLGWYLSTDADKTVIANTGVWTGGNATLVAKYEFIDNRTLTLDAGAGQVIGNNQYVFEQGKPYDFSATDVDAPLNYEFIGWYLDETKVETSGDVFNLGTATEITLVAKYKYVGAVTITFNVGEGTLDGETSITINNGDNYDITDKVPTKDGYRFIGWYLDGEKIANTGAWNFGNEKEYTLVAEYEWIDYRTVNLYFADINAEEPTFIKAVIVEQGTNYDFTLTDTESQGLTLYAWYIDGEETLENTGVWNYGEETEFFVVGLFYKAGEITFELDAGAGTLAGESTVKFNNKDGYDLTNYAPTAPTNFAFEGWFITVDGEEYLVDNQGMLLLPELTTIRLVAKYAYTGKIQVTINVGNGSIVGGNTFEIAYGETYDLSQFVITPPESSNPYDPWRIKGYYVGKTEISLLGEWLYNFGEGVYEITINVEYTNYSLDDNWYPAV